MRSLLPSKLAGGEPGKLEAEWMATTTANVFGPFAPNLVEPDEVAHHHARQRMPDKGNPTLCFDEGVSAFARIFSSI